MGDQANEPTITRDHLRSGRGGPRGPSSNGRLIAGVALTSLGLIIWVLSALQSHREPRSFTDGGPPPQYVAVTAGNTYSISTPGGARVPDGAAADPGGLHCTVAERGKGSSPLAVTVETNTKAVNELATFTAPVSAHIHIDCAGFADVYVDDADGNFDLAGLFVLLATVLLTPGVPLLLSGIATRLRPQPDSGASFEASAVSDDQPLDNQP